MIDKFSRRQGRSGPEVHPHDWDIKEPVAKSRRFRSRSSGDVPIVPAPSIFSDVHIPYTLARTVYAPPTFEQYPAPGHVASHLLVIECFEKLRHEVQASEAFVSYLNEGSNVPELQRNEFSAWMQYLCVAISRFNLWITRIESVIRHSAVFNRHGTGSHLHGAFNKDYLPPLDVLLIWYCYLQNPAAYERLIASNEFQLLSQICFPWHIFPTAIDRDTLEYSSSSAAKALWTNLVKVPFDLQDCLDIDLENHETAFTSPLTDVLELAVAQTTLIGEIDQCNWLRSPALGGTIERARARYAEKALSVYPTQTARTQQIPIITSDTRTTSDLQLDIVTKLLLNTHRAFHAAWSTFAHLYHIRDDERAPPPTYDESQHPETPSQKSKQVAEVRTQECYCWTCERIRDEVEETMPSPALARLSLTSSPDETDEKRSVLSDSSSDTEETAAHLNLTKKQIRAIKADIYLHRQLEAKRLSRLGRDIESFRDGQI